MHQAPKVPHPQTFRSLGTISQTPAKTQIEKTLKIDAAKLNEITLNYGIYIFNTVHLLVPTDNRAF